MFDRFTSKDPFASSMIIVVIVFALAYTFAALLG